MNSIVAVAFFYGVIGCLESANTVRDSMVMAKLSTVLDNPTLPLWDTLKAAHRCFSDRLLHPRYSAAPSESQLSEHATVTLYSCIEWTGEIG